MSIKFNLDFVKDSKELIDGIERFARLMDDKLEIRNIEIFQVDEKAKAKIIYKSDIDYNMNYFTCQVHKDTLEYYFDVQFADDKSIYDSMGDFGFTPDQILYLKYGNQNLYRVEKEGVFDEVGTTFSETELKNWFKEFWDNTYAWESDDFQCWLSTTVNNGYLQKYDLFDIKKDEEYLNELFNQNNN